MVQVLHCLWDQMSVSASLFLCSWVIILSLEFPLVEKSGVWGPGCCSFSARTWGPVFTGLCEMPNQPKPLSNCVQCSAHVFVWRFLLQLSYSMHFNCRYACRLSLSSATLEKGLRQMSNPCPYDMQLFWDNCHHSLYNDPQWVITYNPHSHFSAGLVCMKILFLLMTNDHDLQTRGLSLDWSLSHSVEWADVSFHSFSRRCS